MLKKIANFAVNPTRPDSLDELNLDVAFKVAWAGFLRVREIHIFSFEFEEEKFSRHQAHSIRRVHLRHLSVHNITT